MTIRAYQEIYLNKAQGILGDVFDYAINSYKITGSDFVKMFIVSSISKKMENGEPKYLVGKSGIEVASEIIKETKGIDTDIKEKESYTRSVQYWIGWAVCYYQWYSNRSYTDIFEVISYDELEKMYFTLHEADIIKFVEIVDEKMRSYYKETNLKRIRLHTGLSQAKLSKYSGVSLRSIQMYEQRNKNINKASVDTIYQLSKTLGCQIEDLIERAY